MADPGDDSTFATGVWAGSTAQLVTENYPFTIPTGATITSVIGHVRLKMLSSVSGHISGVYLYLFKSGGDEAGYEIISGLPNITFDNTAFVEYQYSFDPSWLTVSDLNSLGIQMSVLWAGFGGTTGDSFAVRNMRLEVNWTP